MGCTNCALNGTNTPLYGPLRPDFVVVGEAPGPKEVKENRPFVGPAGTLLRKLMADAALDPERALWINTVSCFPNDAGKIRPPTSEESTACRPNLDLQLAASGVQYALLVGAKALNAFRSDLAITKHHGQVFIWRERYCVMPIIHPAAVLRGNPDYANHIRTDLQRWRDIVYGGDDPTLLVGDGCARCGHPAQSWDRDGVPYCKEHWGRFKNQWLKDRTTKPDQLSFEA